MAATEYSVEIRIRADKRTVRRAGRRRELSAAGRPQGSGPDGDRLVPTIWFDSGKSAL